MSEDGNSALNRATDFVNAGNYVEALETARAFLTTHPENGSAKLIEAIALSNLGNIRDASEAFAAAIQLSPTSAKPRFNAAVHEFNNGNAGQARILANEALSLEPNNEGTKNLIERMGPEPVIGASGVSYPRELMSSFEPEYAGIDFVKKMGSGWLAVGWLLSVASLVVMTWSIYNMFAHPSDITSAMNGKISGQAMNSALSKSSIVIMMFDFLFRILSIGWMIIDMIHRRTSFLWLIGHIPCSCVGLACITQPLYIIFGRK
jgi:tetratricopeptide (TPR) repeat protein